MKGKTERKKQNVNKNKKESKKENTLNIKKK